MDRADSPFRAEISVVVIVSFNVVHLVTRSTLTLKPGPDSSRLGKAQPYFALPSPVRAQTASPNYARQAGDKQLHRDSCTVKSHPTVDHDDVRRHLRFMKCCTLPILVALGVVLAPGCSRSGNHVQVISAVYGASTNFADVSIRVSDLVRETSGFNANPNWLQADPWRGWNKTLVIIYEVNGRRHIFTTPEGGSVSEAILLEAARQ